MASNDRAAAPFSRAPLLALIPQDALRALIKSAEERHFRAGQTILNRDDEGESMYAIVSGNVKVFLQNAGGDEILVAMRGAGEVLGEMSLLDGQKRSASAAAYDDVSALCVSRDRFREWLGEHPAAAWALLVALSRRLREATDQVGEIALLGVEARIARRLCQDFERALGKAPLAPGAKLQVNQSELASMLGLTRESVNKHLSRMRARGLIAVGGGAVELLDPDALRALADAF